MNRPKEDSNKIYWSIVELIPNNWIQILKNKTSQESFLKVFHFNDRGIRKVKNVQKLSNKDIYYTLLNNNDDYNRPFKFISWQNHFQENPVLSPEIWGKTFNDWFKKCSNGYIFSLYGINSHISLYPWIPLFTEWEIHPLLSALDARNMMKLTLISYLDVNFPKLP